MALHFSSRIPADLGPNRITQARAAHPPAYDLTVSNPTRCGIPYPPDLLQPLADPAGLVYRPDPRGLAEARRAVAGEYARQGVAVPVEHLVLTASTSEAYALLFKLLCEPGEAVLIGVPSYPLCDHLARVEGVRTEPYHLDPDHGWRLDPHELAAAPADTRAVVVVHPNNPTGSYLDPEDAAALRALCAERGWALIVDEVFLDFPLTAVGARSLAGCATCLTFALGGLSKSVGLPQLKLGWIAASGPDGVLGPALERLEYLADTFLSVATPVQLAAAELLARGGTVRAAIAARCWSNLAALREVVRGHPSLEVLEPGGGWSAVLRFPAVIDEEDLVVELIERDSVAVQPGFYFDFLRDGHLVLSLLPEAAIFRAGVARLATRLRQLG
ncbi:MAG: pyridoxal phosphate-dependent aminotransferase [Thermoanaerobaculaceae bacterium]|nr:pyridoxal phosphate-dependent aminotransferase [Thermoanaerobaculaceae bacterium]MDI9622915.1 pyridoxal phosphate-dependent aminotransferase [Acidobacteriota bacterium]NLH09947.1 pyridoxal phosphate-dependent aminotransferase [Holophagae bacterium]HPW56506.1 pyridoxal phosphate-dependent aminotransferase [Thermoanaerobaculaceae bacterium]